MIAADLDLPFAETAAAGDRPADVLICRGDVPAAFSAPTAEGPCWTLDGDRCLLTVPGIVRCLVEGGRTITFQTEDRAGDGDAAAFALGTAFGVLLHQRGLMVLHASSIEVGGRAALFSGPSGAGKSTMAAALAGRGYPVIADDTCIVDFEADGSPMVRPDGRLVRLWARTVDALRLGDRRRAAVRPGIDKFYVAPPRAAGQRPYPVAVAYRLRTDWRSGPPRLEPVDPVDAVLFLRRAAYRPRYVTAAGQEPRQFQHATRMAHRVPVIELWRRLEFEALPETVRVLEAHWRERGLVGRPS